MEGQPRGRGEVWVSLTPAGEAFMRPRTKWRGGRGGGVPVGTGDMFFFFFSFFSFLFSYFYKKRFYRREVCVGCEILDSELG